LLLAKEIINLIQLIKAKTKGKKWKTITNSTRTTIRIMDNNHINKISTYSRTLNKINSRGGKTSNTLTTITVTI
jgi:hypothetical protein